MKIDTPPPVNDREVNQWLSRFTEALKGSRTFGHRLAVVTTTADLTIDSESDIIICNINNGTVTLLNASSIPWKIYQIKNIHATNLDISPTDCSIDDGGIQTIAQYEALRIVSDGSDYWIL